MRALIHSLRRALAYFLASLVLMPAFANAKEYPSAPITLVVPFPGGGGTDSIGRAVAQAMAKSLGQPVIVENRPGATGALGTLQVVRAKPDGYTLLLGSNGTISINPSLDKKLPYNPVRDLTPVSTIASVPFLLVANNEFAANNIQELIQIAKAEPGVVNFASTGTGSTNHLVGEMLKSKAHLDMVHIPYKGAAPAMNDVAGGTVQFMSGDINTLLPMIQGGKLKPLAVTGSKRSALIPKVPTVSESGIPDFEANGWFGLYAPAGTSENVIHKLEQAMSEALKDPEVINRVNALGGVLISYTGEKFKAFQEKERIRWKEIIQENNIRID